MNLHVDEHIAFEYPEDYLLNAYSDGHTYCLQRGNRFLSLRLLDQDPWWQFLKMQLFHPAQPSVPCTDGTPPGPTDKKWIQDFKAYGFVGEACWFERISQQGDLILKAVDLFVSRGASRLHVKVSDTADFAQGVLDSALESVVFPGEQAYEAARKRGPRHVVKPSPYAVELRYLGEFGQSPKKKVRFNVAYKGKNPVEIQTRAVNLLVRNEKVLFEKVKEAVFRYYTQVVYPILEESDLVCQETKEVFPKIKDVEQIVPLVGFGSFLVHEPREDGTVPVGLRLDCDWDVEHGLGVRVVGLEIEAIGMDQVALFPDHIEWPGFHVEE